MKLFIQTHLGQNYILRFARYGKGAILKLMGKFFSFSHNRASLDQISSELSNQRSRRRLAQIHD
jgi:hypothetical protein